MSRSVYLFHGAKCSAWRVRRQKFTCWYNFDETGLKPIAREISAKKNCLERPGKPQFRRAITFSQKDFIIGQLQKRCVSFSCTSLKKSTGVFFLYSSVLVQKSFVGNVLCRSLNWNSRSFVLLVILEPSWQAAVQFIPFCGRPQASIHSVLVMGRRRGFLCNKSIICKSTRFLTFG